MWTFASEFLDRAKLAFERDSAHLAEVLVQVRDGGPTLPAVSNQRGAAPGAARRQSGRLPGLDSPVAVGIATEGEASSASLGAGEDPFERDAAADTVRRERIGEQSLALPAPCQHRRATRGADLREIDRRPGAGVAGAVRVGADSDRARLHDRPLLSAQRRAAAPWFVTAGWTSFFPRTSGREGRDYGTLLGARTRSCAGQR